MKRKKTRPAFTSRWPVAPCVKCQKWTSTRYWLALGVRPVCKPCHSECFPFLPKATRPNPPARGQATKEAPDAV